MNNEQIWQAVLGEIELKLSKANFTTWFKNTFISTFEENKVVVCVPNTFTKVWLEKKYHPEILSAIENVINQKVAQILYKVEIKKNSPMPVSDIVNKKSRDERIEINITSGSNEGVITNRHGLNGRYTFENFIVGKGNELAYAATQAVAANPGRAYNPLFIYGGVGLGKTHLLQAIGHSVVSRGGKILYVTCEKFTNDYIQAVRNGQAKDFKER